jgi:cytochrome c-type biogenesis protein CcmF
MTRSGVVQSVHAFGEDPKLAMMFTVFMVAIATFSFGFVIYRLPLLRARHELDSWLSREAAFLANNWILLFSAVFILFATMFPTLSESVTGERLTVGPPFFNKWMLPIGLALLALTGIGPLLAWRKSTLASLRQQFLWPVTAGLSVGGVMLALGVPFWASGLCFGLCGFVTTTMLQEFYRGSRVRQQASGADLLASFVGLIARSRRRYGGYVVHLGIVLMFLGFAGEGFKREEQLVLEPGKRVDIGRFTVTHTALRLTDDGQKQMVTAHLAVTREGAPAGELRPAKWFYRKHEEEPTTEVAIRRGFAEDLYIVLAGFEAETQSATLHLVVNPLVNWIWVGFGVLAFGSILALLPERAFAFAQVRAPDAAVTTTVLLLALGLATPVFAQHSEGASRAYLVPRTPLEKALHKEIICMCGTCGRKRLAECTCGMAADMRGEVARLVDQGLTREQVYEHFMAKYGSQEPLASPVDEGFNRLAWAVPYLAGIAGLGLAALFAVRWSRHPSSPEAAPVADDPALEQRLSDELRDLD